ncbi:MAG: hypothetical protein AseanaTS_00570 [Candidatus Pelagadaptatus aseana]
MGVLTGNKRGTTRGTGVFTVVIGKDGAFFGDAVDVRRPVAGLTHGVGTEVIHTDVITPDGENVWLGWVRRRHGGGRQSKNTGTQQ